MQESAINQTQSPPPRPMFHLPVLLSSPSLSKCPVPSPGPFPPPYTPPQLPLIQKDPPHRFPCPHTWLLHLSNGDKNTSSCLGWGEGVMTKGVSSGSEPGPALHSVDLCCIISVVIYSHNPSPCLPHYWHSENISPVNEQKGSRWGMQGPQPHLSQCWRRWPSAGTRRP